MGDGEIGPARDDEQTADDGHPQPNPRAWPECSTCGVAYVLRRCYSLSAGMTWLWQRDCKHKSAPNVGGSDG